MQYKGAFTAIIFLVVASMIASCSSDTQGNGNNQAQASLPDDFVMFYEQFHSDTAYQLSHISFPLEGLRFNDLDTTASANSWSAEEWRIHGLPTDLNGAYTLEYDILSQELIAETIMDTAGTQAMQRRFALTSSGWQLIYYVEMQPAARRVK